MPRSIKSKNNLLPKVEEDSDSSRDDDSTPKTSPRDPTPKTSPRRSSPGPPTLEPSSPEISPRDPTHTIPPGVLEAEEILQAAEDILGLSRGRLIELKKSYFETSQLVGALSITAKRKLHLAQKALSELEYSLDI